MITTNFKMKTKSLLIALQFATILAAMSFIFLYESRTSRKMSIEIGNVQEEWTEQWKTDSQPIYTAELIPQSLVKRKEQGYPLPDRDEEQRGNKSDDDTQQLDTELENNEDDDKEVGGPKILWGIASAFESEMEERRRRVIRTTYLSYYRNNDHFVSNPDRICSLVDVMEKKADFQRCQLIYTFFMGANPNGSEELIDGLKTSEEFLADRSKIPFAERDATYLNIKENQFGGKMQTWYAYASKLVKEGWAFDYIVKADSDTMLYPVEFLSAVNLSLPPNPTRIYTGVSVSRFHCGRKTDEHCNQMVEDYYMGGAAEIMSADLAHYIASLSYARRRALEITIHEDITIGNFVLSHPQGVTKVELGEPWGRKVRRKRLNMPVFWRHDKKTKQPGKWLANWMVYERDLRQRDKTHENVMIIPASLNGETMIKSVIKSGCIKYRKSLVEYCVMSSFAGKTELYLSRLTTNPNSFEVHEKVNDPEEQDDTEEENDNAEKKKDDKAKAAINAFEKAWHGIVVIVVQNPINEHMDEWINLLLPNHAADTLTIQSKNKEALAQLQNIQHRSKTYVVRAEHLWEDVAGLEKLLGNPMEMDHVEWPALSDPALKVVLNVANGKRVPIRLCHELYEEIVAYHELLLLGENLKNSESLRQSLNEAFAMCGVNTLRELQGVW